MMLTSFRLRLSSSALFAVALCALVITLPSGSSCMALPSHADDKSHRRPADPPVTVAVIGSGPGGMFFLHALATLRQKLQQDGDDEALAALPLVTAFERTSSPGGVWKSSSSCAANAANDDEACRFNNNDTASATNTNMYDGLWINGINQVMEFSDFSFDDFFNRPLPIYLPRKSVLEYLLARVTSKEDIFQHVMFDTTVQSVTFEEALAKFVIVTIDNYTGETTVGHYDKCIWAAGYNSIPYFDPDIQDLLLEQKFKGQVVHASEMGSLTSSVQGKRIMLIGDSFSAEDLALQSLKLGAEKVYIVSRSGNGIASFVGAWPGNRVEVLAGMHPFGVADDGNGLLCGGLLCGMFDDGEEDDGQCSVECGNTVIEVDVSIVIFCTGYQFNIDILDPDLASDEAPFWSVPKEWQMKNNPLSAILGTVKPSTELSESSIYVRSGLYRHLLVRNPNMMFLQEVNNYPLLSLDVSAWLLLGYITGTVQVPTAREMERQNSQQLLREMQEPAVRGSIDPEYKYALDRLIPTSHWYHKRDSEEYRRMEDFDHCYEIRLLARDMKDGGYPFSLGTYDELNDKGEEMLRMTAADDNARYQLEENSEDIEWRTFRDIDTHGFSSLITGTEAVPYPGRWMDLDDEGWLDLANTGEQKHLANHSSPKSLAACASENVIVIE